MESSIDKVKAKLRWMREERIWPNGLRYLWTDAFGVVLLVSLRNQLGNEKYFKEAEWIVSEVERVLGRPRGIRIGEESDRDGQYFHYLAMWLFALWRLGEIDAKYHAKAVALVKAIHPHFVIPGRGVIWKMREDLAGPYPGYGLGALDAFHGLVVYRLLDATELVNEIAEMEDLAEQSYGALDVTQDLGLGMLLWMSHFFPNEPWAMSLRRRSLKTLESMWIDPPGYYCREPSLPKVKFAFTNYGLSVGLQAVGTQLHRVKRLNDFFESYRSGDEYDRNAITHVMACSSWFPGELIANR